MGLSRFIPAGATFVWPRDNQPLQEARDLHVPTGVLQPGVGPWGPYLTFDGATTFITLGAPWEDQLRFDAGTLDFSVVAWVRLGTAGSFDYIIGKEDGANDGWRFLVDSAGQVIGSVNALDFVGPAIADLRWHCVAFTVDRSGDAFCYLDGVAGAGGAVGGEVMATTINLRIGARSYDGAQLFGGAIAGILVFLRILTPAECLGLATGRAF